MDDFTFTVYASSNIIICVLVSFDVRWSLAFSCIVRAIRIVGGTCIWDSKVSSLLEVQRRWTVKGSQVSGIKAKEPRHLLQRESLFQKRGLRNQPFSTLGLAIRRLLRCATVLGTSLTGHSRENET